MEEKEILTKWKKISAVIAGEIGENEAFAAKMAAAPGGEPSATPPKKKAAGTLPNSIPLRCWSRAKRFSPDSWRN